VLEQPEELASDVADEAGLDLLGVLAEARENGSGCGSNLV
jgi:hypothetical protein